MQKILLSISLVLIAATSFGQFIWDLSFDDTTFLNRIVIDTNSNPDNIWKIGHPDKTLFISAFSGPNAVVTDTINPYPVNDTSSFSIIHIAADAWSVNYPKIDIGGWYYVNSDTLTDYGYIEFSADHGNSWFMVADYSNWCTWGATLEIPVFSGNSNGWKHFYYCIEPPMIVNPGDTILYRFTFISDNLQTNKDGLMIDNLHFEDWIEGIEEIQNNNLIAICPNPVADLLRVEILHSYGKQTLQILNETSQVVYTDPDYAGAPINTSHLRDGIYLLKFTDDNRFAVKKFVVKH